MKKWCHVIRGSVTGILSVALLCAVGCQRDEDPGEAMGDAMEDAGDATMDAADRAGDEIEHAADEVGDEL